MHTAQLMPLPLTVSCFSKIQIGFAFLVPAHPGSPGQRAIKRVYTDLLTSLTRVFSQPAANIYSSSEHLEHPIVIINSFRPVRCHWLKVIGMSEHCELVPASLRALEAKTSLYRHHGHTAETCHVRDTARPPQPVCLPAYTYLLSSPQKFSKKVSVLMY